MNGLGIIEPEELIVDKLMSKSIVCHLTKPQWFMKSKQTSSVSYLGEKDVLELIDIDKSHEGIYYCYSINHQGTHHVMAELSLHLYGKVFINFYTVLTLHSRH